MRLIVTEKLQATFRKILKANAIVEDVVEHLALSEKIIGAAIRVHRELGLDIWNRFTRRPGVWKWPQSV